MFGRCDAAVGELDTKLTSVPAGAEAKSLKCSDCGKVFRSQATASFHAEKSGHENFEESTEEVSHSLKSLLHPLSALSTSHDVLLSELTDRLSL